MLAWARWRGIALFARDGTWRAGAVAGDENRWKTPDGQVGRGAVARRALVILRPAIGDPLGDIAGHVMEPERVRGIDASVLLPAHRDRDALARLAVERDSVTVIDDRQPGERGEYDLLSLGKDGREGGEGEDQDITNW